MFAYENTERAELVRPEPLPLNRRRHSWLPQGPTGGEPVLAVYPTTQLHLQFTTDCQMESIVIRHAALDPFLSRTLRTNDGPRRLNHWKEKRLHVMWCLPQTSARPRRRHSWRGSHRYGPQRRRHRRDGAHKHYFGP